VLGVILVLDFCTLGPVLICCFFLNLVFSGFLIALVGAIPWIILGVLMYVCLPGSTGFTFEILFLVIVPASLKKYLPSDLLCRDFL